jgi:glycerophosphoryl diester phosphodiesterase
MIWAEILFLILLIISFSNYKRNWIPRNPSFYSKGKLIKIGHRGAPLLAHENTLASFKKAVNTKMNGVELDIQYSADKQLIVYHDWDLVSSTGTRDPISKMHYSEIRKIKLNNEEANKIPLFSEVLDIIPKNYIVVIEIKSLHFFNKGIEKDILEIINNYKIEKNCIISSFNPIVLRRIRKLNPNILTAFLWSKENPQNIINSPLWVWLCRPDCFHADIMFLDKNLMKWIRRKNLSVLTFTIVSQKQLTKAKNLEVDGIIIEDHNLNCN